MARGSVRARDSASGRPGWRVCAAVLFVLACTSASGQEANPRVRAADGLPYLEVEERWSFAVPAPAAVDFRRDAAGRLYLLRPEIGVERYRLAAGVPWTGEVLPGHDDDGALGALDHFAVSDEWAVELSRDHRYVWRRFEGAELSELDLVWGRVSDLDLAGDRLALLGVPSREHAAPGPDDSIVWFGTLSAGLADLRKVLADSSVRSLASQTRLAWAQVLGLGVLRFATNGDLLVYPGHLPLLYRLGADGAVTKTWDLLRLGALEARSQLPDPLTEFGNPGATDAWLLGAQLVDDLAILPDGRPLLLTRDVIGGVPRWSLAVVGDRRSRRYAVPIRSESPTARARVAVDDQGRLLFFVGERAARRELIAGEEISAMRIPASQEVGPTRAAAHPWGRLVDLSRALTPAETEAIAGAVTSPFDAGPLPTRLLAPRAALPGARPVDGVPLEQLIAPAVVIDVEAQTERDSDYSLRVADLEDWEAHNGRVPEGCVVLLRTGWAHRQAGRAREAGAARDGATGSVRSPGFGREVTAVLVRERRVAALGVDAPSLDSGSATDRPALRLAASADVPVLLDLAQLDRLPATGAWIVALPLPLEAVSSAPVRAIAFAP